jgi:hypothetical protein
MKVSDLINELSKYGADTNVELMFAFYTLSAENKPVKVIRVEGDFNVIKYGSTDPILLATGQSLID